MKKLTFLYSGDTQFPTYLKNFRTLFALILSIALCLTAPAGEAQQMYWTDIANDNIQRTDFPTPGAIDTLVSSLNNPVGIALDVEGNTMYWIERTAGNIQRADLVGDPPFTAEVVLSGLSGPRSIALDLTQNKMYWTSAGDDNIERADMVVGGGTREELVSGLNNPFGIALDLTTNNMYWTEFGAGTVTRGERVPDDEGTITVLVSGLGDPRGIALDRDNEQVYYTDASGGASEIRRVNFDGTGDTPLVTGLSDPQGIALEVSDISLPVLLSVFTAESHIDGVLLRWRTESETNNLGFHIYRSGEKAGEYRRITSTLIIGQENTAVAHDYNFLDPTAAEGTTYWYLIEDIDIGGIRERSDPIEVRFDRLRVIPTQFYLWQNYPNPFNPETWIPYELAAAVSVSITIYDPQGNRIRTLSLGTRPAGMYLTQERAAYWDGRSETGESVSSGIYFYHLQAGDFAATQKMLILK